MTQTITNRKKKSKVNQVLASVIGMVIVFVSGVLIFNSAKDWIRLYESSEALKTVQSELAELETKKSELESTRDKLSNPDYVQNYARGVNLMSKSEEQIFVLPKASE